MEVDTLLMVQPQYIFCPTGLKETLAQTDKYKNLTAVQEGRVYEMDPALMQWQGNGVISAVSFMAGTVYPSLAEGTTSLAPEDGQSQAPTGGNPDMNVGDVSSAPAQPEGDSLKLGDEGDAVKMCIRDRPEIERSGGYSVRLSSAPALPVPPVWRE